MASLALWGLGASDEQVSQFYDNYVRRLEPLGDTNRDITAVSWFEQCGDPAMYPAWVRFFEREFARLGGAKLLSTYVAPLGSGWVKNAFHPLIRLAYGIEFGLRSEIIAGLAYLASVGPDPTLATHTHNPCARAYGDEYLRGLQALRVNGIERLPFDQRYAVIIDTRPLYPPRLSARPLPELAHAALAVFDATHDFFALHLVTSLHAFRICAPWLGENAASLAALGLAAGYLAIGAPDFEPLTAPRAKEMHPSGQQTTTLGPVEPDLLTSLLQAPDEHDIKLLHSCRCQARAFGDPSYEAVARRYLARCGY